MGSVHKTHKTDPEALGIFSDDISDLYHLAGAPTSVWPALLDCIMVSSISFQSFLERKNEERPEQQGNPSQQPYISVAHSGSPVSALCVGARALGCHLGSTGGPWPTTSKQSSKPSPAPVSLVYLLRKQIIRADQRPNVIIRNTLFHAVQCQGSHLPRWRKATRHWFKPAPHSIPRRWIGLWFLRCGTYVSRCAICSS